MLAVLAIVLVVVSVSMQGPGAPEPGGPRAEESRRAPGPSSAQVSSSPRPAPSAPRRLSIPAIELSTDLITLGLNSDQTVQVPEDGDDAGWFEHGPVPGQDGSSVILGHVDSETGPAVFSRLSTLAPGDRVRVRRDDARVAVFEVTRVATYENEDFPAQEVYAGSPGAPALNLVTCGGVYDQDRGGWQSNVVVFTEHVRTTPA